MASAGGVFDYKREAAKFNNEVGWSPASVNAVPGRDPVGFGWRGFSLVTSHPVVQTADMSDQPIDFIGAEVDSRSEELFKEFREHRDEFIKENPTKTDSNVIFQRWAVQKLAALQLQAGKSVLRMKKLEELDPASGQKFDGEGNVLHSPSDVKIEDFDPASGQKLETSPEAWSFKIDSNKSRDELLADFKDWAKSEPRTEEEKSEAFDRLLQLKELPEEPQPKAS